MLEAWENLSFEQILEIQQDLGFKSMYAEYSEKGKLDDLPMDDDFLALILNPNAKITIENFNSTLDFEKEKVIAECVESKSYEEFSFEDDILAYLIDGEELSSKISYCTSKTLTNYLQGHECITKYYKAGIYNSLYFKFKVSGYYQQKGWGMKSLGSCYWASKTKNGSAVVNEYGDGSTGDLYRNIYKRSKRLVSYSATIYFWNYDNNDNKHIINICR